MKVEVKAHAKLACSLRSAIYDRNHELWKSECLRQTLPLLSVALLLYNWS